MSNNTLATAAQGASLAQNQNVWEALLAEIRQQFGAKLTDYEFNAFMLLGKRLGADPFKKEIYCVAYNSKDGVRTCNTFLGIGFYNKIAVRNPLFDSKYSQEVYDGDIFEIINGEPQYKRTYKTNTIESAFCCVYRKGCTRASWVRVLFSEYTTCKSLWVSKPVTMIKKVAEMQALRAAFPEDFNGTYSEYEDWNTSDVEKTSQPTVQSVQPQPSQSAEIQTAEIKIDDFQTFRLEDILKYDVFSDAIKRKAMDRWLSTGDITLIDKCEAKTKELLAEKMQTAE